MAERELLEGSVCSKLPLLEDVRVAPRSLHRLGILGARRAHFWRLLARALPHGVHAVHTAIACAVRGEHMIRYTEEVLPLLGEDGGADPRRRAVVRGE